MTLLVRAWTSFTPFEIYLYRLAGRKASRCISELLSFAKLEFHCPVLEECQAILFIAHPKIPCNARSSPFVLSRVVKNSAISYTHAHDTVHPCHAPLAHSNAVVGLDSPQEI